MLVLVIIRLILPVVVLAGVNYALRNKIKNYTGQVEDLQLAMLRGAVTLKKIHFEERDTPGKFNADIESLKFNLSMLDLWNKRVIADIQVNRLNVVLTELSKDETPKPDDLTFVQIREKLAKLKWSSELNKFELRNSSVKLAVPKARVPLYVTNIDADIFNMHFSPDKEWQLADFAVRGLLQGQGEVKLNGQVQALAKPTMADMNLTLENFDLKTLNGLLLNILPMDFTRGKLSVYVEGASEKNFSNGYVKIFFDDVDVVAGKQKFKSGRHVLIEFGSAISHWVLKNGKEKSLAVKVPFKIKHNDVDVKASAAFWSTFENKRDELDRKLENSISFSQNRNDSQMQ